MAPSDADENFVTHQWKSEFASTRSGRNSPNIFAKVRRKLLLTPPVRNARSPRLTEEELDALTGDLPYATNYTYAYSKIYDPSLPDHWEVPNLTGGPSAGYLAEQEHWSAASLGRQLFYLVRLPLYLVLHVITYILEAFYHVIKISSYTIWDYLLYLIKTAKIRYEAWKDHRRRTALIRNRQDPFKVKLSRYFSRFLEILTYVVLAPIRMFSRGEQGVEQYEYKSIKDQLETERASRMQTRSQTLERSRKFEGLSQSPSRRQSGLQTSTVRKTVTKVFASGPEASGISSPSPRAVKERSVTPRFRGSRVTRSSGNRPEMEVDTPLSTYVLRSRISHANTPEPTFDIGRVAATSTPLFPDHMEVKTEKKRKLPEKFSVSLTDKLITVLTYIGYFILFPFIGARYVIYSFYDYGKSAYMRLTNFQPSPMATIHVRDEGEEPPRNTALIAIPWTSRLSQKVSSGASILKESFIGLFAFLIGGIIETGHFLANSARSVTAGVPVSKRFNRCNILGLLLALLLAIFLFGFLLSDNTAIRNQELHKKTNATKLEENALPAVPFWVTASDYVKHYAWMVREYVIDIAFNLYNALKPLYGYVSQAPKAAANYVKSAFYAFWSLVSGALNTIAEYLVYFKNAFLGLFPSSNAFTSITKRISDGAVTIIDGIFGLGNTLIRFLSKGYAILVKVISSVPSAIVAFVQGFRKFILDAINDYIYYPISSTWTYLTGNYKDLLQPINNAAKYSYALFLNGVETVVWLICRAFSTALYIVTWPFGVMTSAWIHISKYAPEEVFQTIPIPQAITPTPLEVLPKAVEVEDEELTIRPAPAPQPIPLPNQPPVVIHQTNVVETVDKEAIIKEVTEKLRAELSAQFHDELSVKFEQNYNAIIEKLKVENTNIQIDNSHMEGLIRRMIYEYDTDKTGQVDFALESSGGAVVSTRCSETFKSYTRLEKFWDIPIYYHHYSPRVVIQRNSKSLFPGECWCFKESRGYIAIELSHFIDVSSISYEHIGQEVAPEGNRTSAPKNVLVWAYKKIDDLNSRVLIGDYTYDLDSPPLQFFIAKHKPNFPVKFVELEVTSNYGAHFTCLYRLRVHGTIVRT